MAKQYAYDISIFIYNVRVITKTCLVKYTESFTIKTECFQIKILIFFKCLLKNIDCWYNLEPPRLGGSNEYQQSIFLSRNKKTNVYHVNPVILYKSGV